MLTFTQAETSLSTARNGRRKLDNNTYLEREDVNTFRITLHGNPVVLIHRNGTFTVDSCGWRTVTTKDRINEFAPVRVYAKNFEWFLDAPSRKGFPVDKIAFEDGMVFRADGVFLRITADATV